MAGPRNNSGVNDFADMYRTVNGERYEWHYAPATTERIAAYRKAGISVRQFRVDGEPQLFVRRVDFDRVDVVDVDLEQARAKGLGE